MTLFQGGTFHRNAAGQMIKSANIEIVFTPEHGGRRRRVTSGSSGRYSISLPTGRYRAEGFQGGRRVFSTGTGFVVARRERQTFNLIISGAPPANFRVEWPIRPLWLRLNGADGWLGNPTTALRTCPKPWNRGRFTHFEGGSIYHTPSTGAIAIPRVIFDVWARHGHERGVLGFPCPKHWGRNLSAYRLNHRDSKVHLFEGGVLVLRPSGTVRVILHSAVTASQFNTRTWSKHGEINKDSRPFVGAQGLTYHPGNSAAERRWFVTKHSSSLPDLDQIAKLDKHFKTVHATNNLGNTVGTDHAGDCDAWQNRIYVACQVPHSVAVLNRNLKLLSNETLKPREDGAFPLGQDKLPWCAVNPCDGLLYTSVFDNTDKIHGFDIRRGYRYTKTITIDRKIDRIQGGAFTPNGMLVLASDDRRDQSFAYLKVFNGHSGALLASRSVERKWTDSTFSDQEIEGVCFAPRVPYGKWTALHTIIIKTNVPNRQCWIKHYHIPSDQLKWL
ncbi:hypothetical protein [Lewinella sp. 4G2]|uniref:hypothetical protein n=1 Tax=Lewinella sp. 4G2 TaxID=1803372 RepID=UPI0007B4A8DE|nr:hypothetical protein [Lewinella sp. 4G2]OAV42854.1 hypothetical protein A3850_016635 [Lewinella sp. 4G2]